MCRCVGAGNQFRQPFLLGWGLVSTMSVSWELLMPVDESAGYYKDIGIKDTLVGLEAS